MKNKKLMLRLAIIISIIIGVILTFGSKHYSFIKTITTFMVVCNIIALIFYIPYIIATKKGKDDNYHSWFFYVIMMALVLTFMIANTVLMELYFEGSTMFSVGLIFLHVISPLLVVCDYVATDSIHDIKLHYFLTGLLPTLSYTLTLIVLQLLLPDSIKSPYFFFDVSKYGLVGVAKNLGIISIVYTPTSYLLYKIKQIKKS